MDKATNSSWAPVDVEPDDSAWRRAVGRQILSEANDLKRTPAALAAELAWSADRVTEIIEGRADARLVRQFVSEMANHYPISLADIWLDPDDTDAGVRIVTAAQSEASARVFDRPDRTGRRTPYYEYRDTAMSRGAPFRPEWISEIRVVDDDDPNNADVAYNQGHILHQSTFFIGPVNFYWEVDGRRHCSEMNTGDSNYITPFIPHSFTSRTAERRGLIIAVTFAGEVARARKELSAMGHEAAEELAGDLRDGQRFARRLQRQLSVESMSEADLVTLLANRGISRERAMALLAGSSDPQFEEVEAAAAALTIRPQDLVATGMDARDAVVVEHRSASARTLVGTDGTPAYLLRPLARSPLQPLMKGFDVSVLGAGNAPFQHSLHEYVYNYGDTPVLLAWHGERETLLAPRDSAYVRPCLRHSFRCAERSAPGQLVVIRIPGALTDSVVDEYAAFEPTRRRRVISEDRTWF